MKLLNLRLNNQEWETLDGELTKNDYDKVNIIFLFGDTDVIKNDGNFLKLKDIFPKAIIVGCSSSGNILGSQISKSTVVATAVFLEKSHIEIASLVFNENDNIEKLSENLIDSLPKENLKHIFLMADGLLINGSELIDEKIRTKITDIKNVAKTGSYKDLDLTGATINNNYTLPNSSDSILGGVKINYYLVILVLY